MPVQTMGNRETSQNTHEKEEGPEEQALQMALAEKGGWATARQAMQRQSNPCPSNAGDGGDGGTPSETFAGSNAAAGCQAGHRRQPAKPAATHDLALVSQHQRKQLQVTGPTWLLGRLGAAALAPIGHIGVANRNNFTSLAQNAHNTMQLLNLHSAVIINTGMNSEHVCVRYLRYLCSCSQYCCVPSQQPVALLASNTNLSKLFSSPKKPYVFPSHMAGFSIIRTASVWCVQVDNLLRTSNRSDSSRTMSPWHSGSPNRTLCSSSRACTRSA
jgi:hypothetical protein